MSMNMRSVCQSNALGLAGAAIRSGSAAATGTLVSGRGRQLDRRRPARGQNSDAPWCTGVPTAARLSGPPIKGATLGG